jgi:hypothetical protein
MLGNPPDLRSTMEFGIKFFLNQARHNARRKGAFQIVNRFEAVVQQLKPQLGCHFSFRSASPSLR